MRKVVHCVMAAALTAGLGMFASCTTSNNDNPAGDGNLTEQIQGKWILMEEDGSPVVTDETSVFTFEKQGAGLKAFYSTAIGESRQWIYSQSYDVAAEGNNLALTKQMAGGLATTCQMNDVRVDGNSLSCTTLITIGKDGQAIATYGPNKLRLSRIVASIAASDLVGTWDGYYTSDDPAAGSDPERHRAVFRADGTCNYYYPAAGGQYELDPTVYSRYYVDGTLLSLCWLDFGEGQKEQYENWEVLLCSANKITARSFHKRADGTLYTDTYHLSRVE